MGYILASSLNTFLEPRSVAIIGASPDHTKLRGRIVQILIKNGYPGALYLINPTHKTILGRTCHPAIAAVPAPVDLAIIIVPASKVVDALEECVAAGARNALILSSGFAEEGGAQSDAQERIAKIARDGGIRVCGPNAEGFHNEIGHISATFSPAVDLDPARHFTAAPRRCGVIAQSGGLGFSLYHVGRSMGLAFSRVVTTGNESDLTAADFLDHMAGDEETAVIILFLETVRDATTFMAAARRAALARKPIVVVKVGRSEAGGRATASHTGSMAGWDAAYDAMFRQYGMTVVDDPVRALAIAGAFATCPLPRGNRAAVVTVSGGGGALMADALTAAGLALPELRPETQAVTRGMIPSYGATRNPVDITGQATWTGAPLKIIEQLCAGDEADLIVAVLTTANETRVALDPEMFRPLVALQRKPILFYTYTVASDFARRALAAAGTLIYFSATDLAAAARSLVEYANFRLAAPPAASAQDTKTAAALSGLEDGVVSEVRSKALLAGRGLRMPPGRLVTSVAELHAAGATLGYPVAVKIQSRDIPHKTEAGGVRLNVANRQALEAAYAAVLAATSRYAPQARIDGVLIERMAPTGIEMIVGLVRDDTFGPVLTVGAGGVTTELYRDVAHRLAPVSEDEAHAMLRKLTGFPLLSGYRGAPCADVAALAALIARVSAFAGEFSDSVSEVELNPVIVHAEGEGCSIADAMLVLARRQ